MDPDPTQQPGHFRVTLRALPSNVPATARLRQLLKAALRSWRFRAVEVQELPLPDAPAAPGTPPAAAGGERVIGPARE